MFGCCSPAACSASRWKRSTNWGSCRKRLCRTFSATCRCRCASSASQTSAMPPLPIRRKTRYRLSTTLPSRTSATVPPSFPVQDRYGDVAEDRRRDVVAELFSALDRGRDRDLRFVGRSEAHKPGLVLVFAAAAGLVAGGFRGPGLAGDRDAGDRRVGAGAFADHAFHRRRQLFRGLTADRLAVDG